MGMCTVLFFLISNNQVVDIKNLGITRPCKSCEYLGLQFYADNVKGEESISNYMYKSFYPVCVANDSLKSSKR